MIISMLADGEATLEVLAQIAPACQPQAIYCQMGTIGLPETRQAIALLRELQPAMTYIDAPVSGTKAPAEKAQIRCSPAAIGKRAPLPNRCLRLSPAGRSGLARRATARK
nr:NAD binding domain of 6-phosphogluconate dehydrogenase [Klebsiella pneumoniae]